MAEGLGVAWNTANDGVLAEGKRVLIEHPGRFDGVQVIRVDDHAWRHTRRGIKYVTVIIDPTPICDGTGLARLLGMGEGRSKQAFMAWLADRPEAWRWAVEGRYRSPIWSNEPFCGCIKHRVAFAIPTHRCAGAV